MYINPIDKDDTMSVCSCTCYPQPRSRSGTTGKRHAEPGFLSRLLTKMGVRDNDRTSDNYYDSETQSISNYTKLAVKRSSF